MTCSSSASYLGRLSLGKPNLATGTAEDIRQFVVAVAGLAVDHEANHVRDGLWSGQDLCRELTSQSRVFHRRMATGIYNNTRQTMRLFNRDRQDG